MKVLKFGGTSLKDGKRILNSASIISEAYKKWKVIVVLSAMSQVTNKLITLYETASKWHGKKADEIIDDIEKIHYKALKLIMMCDLSEKIWVSVFSPHFIRLRELIKWISLIGDIADKHKAKILYYWETLSTFLMVEALKIQWIEAEQVYSKNIIRTDTEYMNASVDFKKTWFMCKMFFKKMKNVVPVVTGFAWWDHNKHVALLDRGGSDYVATIIWSALKVDCIEIWTDVDWIYSSDPRIIENTIVWEKLDFRICAELALAGAKVLHPKTISPAVQTSTPVFVKNTLNPGGKWTEICHHKSKWMKGVNLNNNQLLVHFTDPTMYWATWYISKITWLFSNNDIAIDSLATSEVSLTCSINKKMFTTNLLNKCKQISEVSVLKNVSKISLVWEEIWQTSCFANEVFDTLKWFTVHLISKWASNNNITLFVDEKDWEKITKLLHKRFFE